MADDMNQDSTTSSPLDTTTPVDGKGDLQQVVDPVAEKEARDAELVKRQAIGKEVTRKYEQWRSPRKPYELQWFINKAYDSGKHTSEAVPTFQALADLSKLDRTRKNIANKLWAKNRARYAKFVKSRPKGIVVPFTHQREDRLNARMTERALDYVYERADQEEKYNDVLLWARYTGKAYWGIHWNDNTIVPVRTYDPLTKEPQIEDAEGGDIEISVESGFAILVPDLRKSRLKDQFEIMHVAIWDVEEAKARYSDWADYIKPDSHMGSPFEFERQMAHLSSNDAGSLAGASSMMKGEQTGVLVKSHFTKPNSKHPKGRMIVVINDIAVKVQEELPHEFWDMSNPYPYVEFSDIGSVGQFYVTTFIEQLIPLQRGYNMLRDKLEKQIKQNVHPKWVVTRQSRIPKGALTNESGEVVEWNFIPGMPEPHTVTPGNIVADAWRFASLLKEEFDDISQVYPSSEGKTGSSKSGFQTNLLQEASDSVHSPDARGYELAIKDASYKLRRLMKKGYTTKRLLSFAGRSSIPEVFEFSSDNIDEHALIRVQIGSGLSGFKATRIQQLMEFHEKGLLGDPNDPEVKRRVLSLIDLGGIEEFQEKAARDEDMARMENIDILDNQDVHIPQFYEDHMVHYSVHTDELKSPANKDMPNPMKLKFIGHVLLHMKFINPQAAYEHALEYGLNELIGPGMIQQPAPTPPAAPGPPAPGGPTPPPSNQPAPPPPPKAPGQTPNPQQ